MMLLEFMFRDAFTFLSVVIGFTIFVNTIQKIVDWIIGKK